MGLVSRGLQSGLQHSAAHREMFFVATQWGRRSEGGAGGIVGDSSPLNSKTRVRAPPDE